nr:hypothetical protein [Tanacetum cinerariifolium]
MASTAAKSCQEDSSEFYLITGSIYTNQRRIVVIETIFDEVTKTLSSISVDYHTPKPGGQGMLGFCGRECGEVVGVMGMVEKWREVGKKAEHEEEEYNDEFYEVDDEDKLDEEEKIDDEEDDEVIKELYDDVNVNLGNDDSEMTDADQGALE